MPWKNFVFRESNLWPNLKIKKQKWNNRRKCTKLKFTNRYELITCFHEFCNCKPKKDYFYTRYTFLKEIKIWNKNAILTVYISKKRHFAFLKKSKENFVKKIRSYRIRENM